MKISDHIAVRERRASMGDFYETWLDDWIAPYERANTPRILGAIEKFGSRQVFKFIDVLQDWIFEKDPVQDKLAKLKPIMQAIFPMPRPPRVLYRGLRKLKEYPTEGSEITYSTKRPYNSWSENVKIAKDFCRPHGIVLQVESSVLLKNPIWLWPLGRSKDLAPFLGIGIKEQEWGVKLTKPIKVKVLEVCT